MRKNYYQMLLTLVMAFVFQGAWAQTAWTTHSASTVKGENLEVKNSVAGVIYLGHCNYDDYIYEYDGLSLDQDARVGVGIKLLREQFKN